MLAYWTLQNHCNCCGMGVMRSAGQVFLEHHVPQFSVGHLLAEEWTHEGMAIIFLVYSFHVFPGIPVL
jgi:hypothetical protein